MPEYEYVPSHRLAGHYGVRSDQVEELARRHHIIGGLRFEPGTGCEILVHRRSTEALLERLLAKVKRVGTAAAGGDTGGLFRRTPTFPTHTENFR